MLEALDLGDVRMAVDDGVAIFEAGREAGLSPDSRPGVVHHPDSHVRHLHHPLPLKRFLQRRLVHIPVHSFEGRTERAKLLVEPLRYEVAAVQNELRGAEQPDAFSR